MSFPVRLRHTRGQRGAGDSPTSARSIVSAVGMITATSSSDLSLIRPSDSPLEAELGQNTEGTVGRSTNDSYWAPHPPPRISERSEEPATSLRRSPSQPKVSLFVA